MHRITVPVLSARVRARANPALELAAASFRERGFCILRRHVRRTSSRWADEVARRRAADLAPLRALRGVGDVLLARSEGFADAHERLGALAREGALPAAVGAVAGDAMTLFKEKLNYKLPGGAGFAAHQDAPAYPEAAHHVTALVAIDAATARTARRVPRDARLRRARALAPAVARRARAAARARPRARRRRTRRARSSR